VCDAVFDHDRVVHSALFDEKSVTQCVLFCHDMQRPIPADPPSGGAAWQ
jgi:hypothetical protein